jgi:hypothetical protein
MQANVNRGKQIKCKEMQAIEAKASKWKVM